VRYGFKTAPMNTTWPAMLDVWRAGDELDVFESAWNFDHFEPIFSDRSGPCMEGWSMLAAMAAVTSRVKLGCQVTGMPYRHPSVLANIAATVDVISDGRLIIGLGAGWNQDESDALGIRLPPLKERFDQFEEGVQVIIKLLSEDRASFQGRHFTLTEAWCEPKPVQRPHPPIAIGGNGEKRTLRVVARYAQHWNSTLGDVAQWQAKCEVLDRHCAEAGRDPAEIERSVNVRLSAGADPRDLQPQVQAWKDAGADVCVVYLGTPHDAGVMEPLAKALAEVG
jgi:F420-dependent oxidoreductase-like protein